METALFHLQPHERVVVEDGCFTMTTEGEHRILTGADQLLDFMHRNPHISVLGIDDAQFISPPQECLKLRCVLDILANQGKHIIIAGVDQDFEQKPFTAISQLLAIAEKIHKIRGICGICRGEATKSILKKRLGKRATQLLDGKLDTTDFEARCKQHAKEEWSDSDPPPGRLTVITGPMFSRKSLELILLRDSLGVAQHAVAAFAPPPSQGKIESRGMEGSSISISAFIAENADDVRARLRTMKPPPSTVLIDEAHLFSDSQDDVEELIDLANELNLQGINVVVAGLDMDFLGEPFENVAQLMAIADDVIKLTAICHVQGCTRPATRTARIDEKGERKLERIHIPREAYKPLCRLHHAQYIEQRFNIKITALPAPGEEIPLSLDLFR
jgi:thymidine kinase